MSLHPDSCSFFIEDALNISSPPPQPPAIGNRTIQSYVKAYVEKFVGGYTVVSNLAIICLIQSLIKFLSAEVIITSPFLFLFFQVGLNLTSSDMRSELPDNRTIQNIVRDYVDEYVGRYPVACNVSVSFELPNVKKLQLSKHFLR